MGAAASLGTCSGAVHIEVLRHAAPKATSRWSTAASGTVPCHPAFLQGTRVPGPSSSVPWAQPPLCTAMSLGTASGGSLSGANTSLFPEGAFSAFYRCSPLGRRPAEAGEGRKCPAGGCGCAHGASPFSRHPWSTYYVQAVARPTVHRARVKFALEPSGAEKGLSSPPTLP